MKKWIIIAVVAILLFAGGAYLLFANNQTTTPTQQSSPQTAEQTKNDENSITGNIFSLLQSGQNVACTFSSTADDTSSSGTVYVSGKNMRGDFQSTINSQTSNTHMIRDGEWMYTWTDGQTTGLKLKITEEDERQGKEMAEKMESDKKNQGFDISQQVDYSCKPWGVDQSKFTVPSNVTFTDLSAQMEDAKNMMQNSSQSACSACETITDTQAKAACKQSLNCN